MSHLSVHGETDVKMGKPAFKPTGHERSICARATEVNPRRCRGNDMAGRCKRKSHAWCARALWVHATWCPCRYRRHGTPRKDGGGGCDERLEYRSASHSPPHRPLAQTPRSCSRTPQRYSTEQLRGNFRPPAGFNRTVWVDIGLVWQNPAGKRLMFWASLKEIWSAAGLYMYRQVRRSVWGEIGLV